jgi:hypothetical protein
MWLIVLEAMAALAVLLFLVWWTMFSGRRRGEPLVDEEAPPQGPLSSPAPPEADEAASGDGGGQTKLKG